MKAEYKTLKYRPEWKPVPRVTCECGKFLSLGHSKSIRHRSSVFHKNHRRIKRLLDSPCVSFSEVARRLPVTPERVRQIADRELKGLKGHPRQQACSLEHRTTEISPLVKMVLDKCAERKIPSEPKMGFSRFWSTAVLINGKEVRISSATPNARGYVALHRTNADFLIVFIVNEKDWLIIPRAAMPTGSTTISLNPPMSTRGISPSRRHDWRQYINAWHLLKSENLSDRLD